MVWNEEVCREFWWFIAERHEIFRRRIIMRQPFPWTDDPILQSVAFTNIYRELDRATRVLIRSWPAYASREDMMFNILKFRFFTLPATYEALGGFQAAVSWKPELAETTLLERWRADQPVFTNAFMYTGSGAPGPGGKIKAVIRRLTDIRRQLSDYTRAVFEAASMPPAHRYLDRIPGFGWFMSYEVLIDVTYTGMVDYGRDEWVYAGPGAVKGLQVLLADWTHYSVGLASALILALRDWQSQGFVSAGVKLNGPRLTLENIEQALCEFAKYKRALADGWSKRKYDAARANTDYSLWDDIPLEFLRKESGV